MAYRNFLMPTNTRNRATGKTPKKTTSYDLDVSMKKKKLRKMVLQEEEEEEDEEEEEEEDDDDDEQPLVKRTKFVKKVAQNLSTKAIQEEARLIAFALLNQTMEQPSIAEVLQKQVEARDEVVLKEVEGISEVGASHVLEKYIAHALETILEEEKDDSDDAESVHTGNPLNDVSDNVLNSSMSPLMAK